MKEINFAEKALSNLQILSLVLIIDSHRYLKRIYKIYIVVKSSFKILIIN